MPLHSTPRRRAHLQVEELETRNLLSGFAPTPVEQQFLELLNNARANPAAYGASIGVDLSYIAPSPPLAFDPRLIQAAYLDALDMSNRNFFAHVNPDGLDPGQRMTNAGYPWVSWGESIAAGSGLTTPAAALALLIIDAGVPNLGHRNHLLANGYPDNIQKQVGIGIVLGGTGQYTNYYTIDTGVTANSPAYLTGVVFNDANHNGLYDIGEGLGAVTITVGGVGSVTDFDTGGYSIPLNPGTYTVTASGGALLAPVTQTVTVGTQNVRLNFSPPAVTASQWTAWVTELYKDLLHRTPAPAEVAPWVNGLQLGVPRQFVVSAFLGSAEYNQGVVTQIFQQFLHRAPDAASLPGFVAALQSGVPVQTIQALVINSAEYWTEHGATADGFVQGLYTDLLGRAPVGGEAGSWVNAVAAGNKMLVISGILYGAEHESVVVSSLYQTYLRRGADPGGLAAFVNYLQLTGNIPFAIEALLLSAEYFTGSQTW